MSGQKSHRNKMPLGTLQHNAELVKRNFINLRTVWDSLFHLLSPVSLSDYSSFQLWLFLFSPHNSLLSWLVFTLLKTIFFSCSLCHSFSLPYGFTYYSHFFSGHSCSFLAIVILHFFDLALSPLTDLLSTSLLLVWCFLFFHICIPEEIKFPHLESYLFPILAILPFLTVFYSYSLTPHCPANFLYPYPLATQQNIMDKLWMSLQPQEWCLQKQDWAERKHCLCTS